MGMKRTSVRGVYDRDGVKIIDKLVDGIRIYENCGKVTIKFAEQVLNKKIAALLEGRYFPEKQNRSLTVRDALNIYWKEKLQYLGSAKNAKFLLSKIDDRLGILPVKCITIAHIEKYKRERLAERRQIRYKDTAGQWQTKPGALISPRTVQAEPDQLNLALNWMRRNRRIVSNPIAEYEKVDQEKPKKVMIDVGKPNGAEWHRLYNASCDDLKPLLVVLYETSMRPGEVFKMCWDWIDLFKRVIRIPTDVEKTRDGRNVPISGTLFELLRGIPQDNDLVFPSPVTHGARKGIKKAFDGAVARAGLSGRGITPVCLKRRTRLTIWDAVDPAAAMSAGDHRQSKNHYDHYVEITDDRLLRLAGERT